MPLFKALHYSTSSKIDLSGVFPPVVTPFNADQSIAWPKLEANIEKLNTEPLAGYLVATGGSAVYSEASMSRFRDSGPVVYLAAALESLTARVQAHPDRGRGPGPLGGPCLGAGPS